MLVNATELAGRLGVSKARVSQYVSAGVLRGCFEGEGRARRFDLGAVQRALNRGLDAGQMMGNGAGTRRALRQLTEMEPETEAVAAAPVAARAMRSDGPLPVNDPSRYELAKIQIAEEDARTKRRNNERDEGRWVLAEDVERNTARLVAREFGQFEAVLRDGARAIADQMGIDFRQARQILMQQWRAWRQQKVWALTEEAEKQGLSDSEREQDI